MNKKRKEFLEALIDIANYWKDKPDGSFGAMFSILAMFDGCTAHTNFRVVSAGNTYGLGANYDYVGRNQLDMASLDRFAMVRVDYSKAIELKVANGNQELVDFCEDFRNASIKAGVRCVISYRAIGRLAKMESLFDLKDAIRTCLTKSLEKDDLNAIKSCMEVKSGKYYKALCGCSKCKDFKPKEEFKENYKELKI